MLGNFPYPAETCEYGKGQLLRCIFLMGWGGGDEIGTIVISYTFSFLDRGWGEISFHQFVGWVEFRGGGGWGILNLFSVWYRVGFLEFGTLVYRLSRGLKRCFLFYFSIKSELASTMQWRFYLTPVEESRRKKNLRNQGSGLPYKGYRSSGQCLIMHFFPVLHISVRVVDHAMPSAGLSETTKPWKKYSKP